METERSHIPSTADLVLAPGRPGAVIGLLAALAACVAFWVLFGLTLYWLI